MHVLLCSSVNQDCEPEGGLYGGPGGGYFDDGCDRGKIQEVRVYAALFAGDFRIQAIVTVYEQETTTHGIPSGSPAFTVDVGSDEAIVAVVGNAGDTNHYFLNQLGFIVMAEDGSTQLYGPAGEATDGDNFIFCGEVQSFRGRSGSIMDAIGFNTD